MDESIIETLGLARGYLSAVDFFSSLSSEEYEVVE